MFDAGAMLAQRFSPEHAANREAMDILRTEAETQATRAKVEITNLKVEAGPAIIKEMEKSSNNAAAQAFYEKLLRSLADL